jgi:hypothetical protein
MSKLHGNRMRTRREDPYKLIIKLSSIISNVYHQYILNDLHVIVHLLPFLFRFLLVYLFINQYSFIDLSFFFRINKYLCNELLSITLLLLIDCMQFGI